MKPISVRFKCFGPYMKEQVIDFRQLEENGLFLICGETGSGKTSILDAMCYALYGKSSGGLRGDLSAMRCKHARPEDETFVEYIFANGDNTYRFYRSIKPRKKRKAAQDSKSPADMNETCECQILRDGEFVPVPDAKDKKTFLNEKARQIIGLTYEQFCQVIILPQGQFEKLLVSDSQEKEKILVTLFHAERWQKIALTLFDRADKDRRELEKEKLRMEEHLRSYGCQNPQQLSEAAEMAASDLQTLNVQLTRAQTGLDACQKQFEEAKQKQTAFEELDRSRRSLEAVLQKIPFYDREEEILQLADRAETIAPAYREFQLAVQEERKKAGSAAEASREVTAAREAWKQIAAEKLAHEEKREMYLACKSRIILLENARMLYQSLTVRQKEAAAAEQEEAKACRIADQAEAAFQNARTVWEQTVQRQKDAIDAHRQAQMLYLQGIGSILAEQLREGEKCPVCGSCHHPEPARPIEGHVTEQLLDQMDQAMDKANREETTARRRYTAAQEQARAAQTVLAEQQQRTALAQSAYRQALEQRLDGVDSEQQRLGELKRLSRMTEQFEEAEAALQQRENRARSDIQAAEKTLEKAGEEASDARSLLEAQQEKWQLALTDAGFSDERQYLGAVIPAQQRLDRRKALLAYRTALQTERKTLEELERSLEGQQRPDLPQLRQQLQEAQAQRDRISRECVLKEKECTTMQQDAKALHKRAEKYEAAKSANDEAMVYAKRLRGDYGISLQRYVLGVMLTAITHAANSLLKTVYGGRYQLYRTNETSGTARKRGLELEVADRDGRRSVTTLSGGEKFLLALSLAIGLSTVVQAQGQGVRMEAMFIDEGFGSLDRNSIDDALEVLQTVRRSSGIVGIISHVDRLSETIPAKIEITKTKEGSQCRISC